MSKMLQDPSHVRASFLKCNIFFLIFKLKGIQARNEKLLLKIAIGMNDELLQMKVW